MNKFRKGLHVKYKDREYPAMLMSGGRYELLSPMTEAAPEGFRPSSREPGMNFRVVTREEAESACRIVTVIKYKGRDFLLSEEKEGYVLIEERDAAAAEKFGMDRIAANLYIKWIKLEEIQGSYEKLTDCAV